MTQYLDDSPAVESDKKKYVESPRVPCPGCSNKEISFTFHPDATISIGCKVDAVCEFETCGAELTGFKSVYAAVVAWDKWARQA